MQRLLQHVGFVPIVLKKSFWGDDQNFSGLLMRFARGDMRDYIVSHKNDHGASYERYGVLQWWSRLKISFCEIFGVVQFSTFATLSASSGPTHCSKQRAEHHIAGPSAQSFWKPGEAQAIDEGLQVLRPSEWKIVREIRYADRRVLLQHFVNELACFVHVPNKGTSCR
jgi:hypothetical protein